MATNQLALLCARVATWLGEYHFYIGAMMSVYNNEPAMPRVEDYQRTTQSFPGLSRLEWMTGNALQGLLAGRKDYIGTGDEQDIALLAVKIAEETLEILHTKLVKEEETNREQAINHNDLSIM